jgi:hypothetical protein
MIIVACFNRFQQNIKYKSFLRKAIYKQKMELILDHYYDFSKPVYMLHPQNKFWEVKLDVKNVTYRVGKVKEGVESGIEQI